MLAEEVKDSCANQGAVYGVLNIAKAALRALSCGSYLEPASSSRWFCFRSQINRHGEAVGLLDQRGFEVFYPLFRTRRPSGKLDVRSLFPRYGFVRFDITRPGWRAVCSTPGVELLLGSHPERPTPIPVGVVEGLLAQLSSKGWIEDESCAPIQAPIEPGVTVRIKSGPFTQMHGICKWSSSQRIGILLDLFGATRTVTVPRKAVEIRH